MAHIALDARGLGENDQLDTNILNTLHALKGNDGTHSYSVLCFPSHERAIKLISEDFNCIPLAGQNRFSETYEFQREKKKNRFDLTHFLSDRLPIFPGNRSIVSLHRVAEFFAPEGSAIWRMKQRIKKARLGYFLKKVTAITVQSERAKKDVAEIFHINDRNIHVLTPVVAPEWHASTTEIEIEQIKKTYNTWDEYFLGYAFDSGIANAVRLVKAFGRYARMKEGIKLVLVGKEGSVSHAVRDAIVTGELRSRITLVGAISEADRILLSQWASGIVYSSLYTENSIPVIEARTVRTPIAFSNTWAMESLGESDGIPFHPIREESIVEALLALGEKEKTRNIEDRVPDYSTLRTELLHLYQKFLPLSD